MKCQITERMMLQRIEHRLEAGLGDSEPITSLVVV
jgi:hypothetical protein